MDGRQASCLLLVPFEPRIPARLLHLDQIKLAGYHVAGQILAMLKAGETGDHIIESIDNLKHGIPLDN